MYKQVSPPPSSPEWEGPVASSPVHLSLGYGVPAELQFPVETAVGHVGPRVESEVVVADYVDDRANHIRPVSETEWWKKHCFKEDESGIQRSLTWEHFRNLK